MAAPYVSTRRLTDNALAAMLAAVEIYNKPQVTYRDEITVILVVNAWELALKAALRDAKKSIFYPKKRGEPYRSLSIDDSLGRVSGNALWPVTMDGPALTANIKALTEYRDRAIHLYNARGLGAVIYPFLQQNVLNFRDFVFAKFKRDLADSMTWQLLPLGATAPADGIQFMKAGKGPAMVSEVQHFIEELRRLMDEAVAAGSDTARVAAIYDINLRSVKKLTSADLIVAVSQDADGQIVFKKTDPNDTHPYTMTQLLERVNAKRDGRALNSYDYQAVCWKEGLRGNSKYAWKHRNGGSYDWSGDAIAFFVAKSDSYYAAVRAEYGAHQKALASK